jgi:hypothetical protein
MEGAAGQGRKSESFGAAFCWRFSQEKVIGRRVLILANTDHHWTGAPAVTGFTLCTHDAVVERLSRKDTLLLSKAM